MSKTEEVTNLIGVYALQVPLEDVTRKSFREAMAEIYDDFTSLSPQALPSALDEKFARKYYLQCVVLERVAVRSAEE